MQKLASNLALLVAGVVVAASCSSLQRDFGTGAGAGSGEAGVSAGGTSGALGEPATNEAAGSSGDGGTESNAGSGAAGRGSEEDSAGAGGAPDTDCDGTLKPGCSCVTGQQRSCAEAGGLGSCAAGEQLCSDRGVWGLCSITPAALDSCDSGNDDNCNGIANEACSCINGITTQSCGACSDGTQVCSNGKTNKWSACTGAVLSPTTYYRDADGDGFGSAATTTVCGPPPAGYVDQTGDCCDDGGDLAVAKTIFPHQPAYFPTATTVCNIGWDYNCSGAIETTLINAAGCATDATYPTCAQAAPTFAPASSCGKLVGGCSCYGIDEGQGGKGCTAACGSATNACH